MTQANIVQNKIGLQEYVMYVGVRCRERERERERELYYM